MPIFYKVFIAENHYTIADIITIKLINSNKQVYQKHNKIRKFISTLLLPSCVKNKFSELGKKYCTRIPINTHV